MQRRLSIALLALALSASVTAVYFYRENLELRRQLMAAAPIEPDSSPATTVDAGTRSADSMDSASVASSDAVAAAVPAEGRGGRGNFRRGGDGRDRGGEVVARMLTDPEMRAAAMSRAKAQVDRMYGNLFVKLGLNEEQVEALRTLLAEREMAQLEAGMLQRTAETDQAREEARAWRDSKYASLEAGINSVLGADGMQLLQDYQRSLPQREAVEDIGRRASYAGAPLTAETSDRLVQLLAQVQREMPVQNPLFRGGWNNGGAGGDNANAPAAGQAQTATTGRQRQPLTADAANQYLTALEAQNQALLQQASGFLTTPQLEALADRQLEQYEQAQQQLDIALKNPDLPVGGFGGGRGGFVGGGRGGGGGGGPRGGGGAP